jgi:hypothetical protein
MRYPKAEVTHHKSRAHICGECFDRDKRSQPRPTGSAINEDEQKARYNERNRQSDPGNLRVVTRVSDNTVFDFARDRNIGFQRGQSPLLGDLRQRVYSLYRCICGERRI